MAQTQTPATDAVSEREYQQAAARDAQLRQAVLARVRAAHASFSPRDLQSIEDWARRQTDAILLPARGSKGLFTAFLKDEKEKQDNNPWWHLAGVHHPPPPSSAAMAAHQRLRHYLIEKQEARKRK